jgi:phosphoribosylformylglycinamidine (FGAM) synthase PurS component
MIIKLEMNTNMYEKVCENIGPVPVFISNTTEELKTEIIRLIPELEIGDVISIGLVRDPDEEDIKECEKYLLNPKVQDIKVVEEKMKTS